MMTISLIIVFIYTTLPGTIVTIMCFFKTIKKNNKSLKYKKADVYYTYVDRSGKLRHRK